MPNQIVNASSEKDIEKVDEVKDEKNVFAVEEQPKATKPKKEKQPKPTQNVIEPPVDVGRLDLRIAKVEAVQKHPDADSLYVLKINCGEEKPRTVCSGLVKYVSIDELRDRYVVLLCNLKPVKVSVLFCTGWSIFFSIHGDESLVKSVSSGQQ